MILITGITGHSGKYFLQELIDNSNEVEKATESIRVTLRENSDTTLLDKCGLPIERRIGSFTPPLVSRL